MSNIYDPFRVHTVTNMWLGKPIYLIFLTSHRLVLRFMRIKDVTVLVEAADSVGTALYYRACV